MKTVYLGLGSNLGDREAMLQDAIFRLAAGSVRPKRLSSVWETSPVGFAEQGWFLNMVVEAETELFPMMLMKRLLDIEREMGRRRTTGSKNGPRGIDLDILLYGRAVIETPQLTIPHPRMTERRFVLAPLAELAPDVKHPILRRSIRELLKEVEGQPARRAAFAPLLPDA